VAQLTGGDSYEGITTIPNDAQKYGPWAGRIIVGDDHHGYPITAIDTNGIAVPYFLGIGGEDIRVIPADQNFFGVDDNEILWGAPAAQFQGLEGEILVASEEDGSLNCVRWNGSSFDVYLLAEIPNGWEAVNFAPAGVTSVAPASYLRLDGSVADDGQLIAPTSNTWLLASGPAPVVFDNPGQTNTLAHFTGPGTNILTLSAFDGQYMEYSNITIQVVRNQAPSVNAGSNQIISITNATLTNVVSDDGWPSNVLDLSWSVLGKPPGASVHFGWTSLSTNSTAVNGTNSASFSTSGQYVLLLTADDGQATNNAEVTITVQAPSLILTPVYGWPTYIPVPPRTHPQSLVRFWRARPFPGSTFLFKNFWRGGGPHDYKKNDATLDAFGNFAFGATGRAAGFPLSLLQTVADMLHPSWANDPINTADIDSGFHAIDNNGTLSTKVSVLISSPQ